MAGCKQSIEIVVHTALTSREYLCHTAAGSTVTTSRSPAVPLSHAIVTHAESVRSTESTAHGLSCDTMAQALPELAAPPLMGQCSARTLPLHSQRSGTNRFSAVEPMRFKMEAHRSTRHRSSSPAALLVHQRGPLQMIVLLGVVKARCGATLKPPGAENTPLTGWSIHYCCRPSMPRHPRGQCTQLQIERDGHRSGRVCAPLPAAPALKRMLWQVSTRCADDTWKRFAGPKRHGVPCA